MSSQRGTNLLNKYGKRTKCAICQSVYHWAKECLNKAASNSVKLTESVTIENCNLTLFTNEHPSINEVFAIESSCSAVIDTACTTTVCGEKWCLVCFVLQSIESVQFWIVNFLFLLL